MSPLVVEVDGRVLRLAGSSVIRIGRAIEAEVVLTAGSVSRQHAELRPVDGSWVLVDTGSQFGTYVDGLRVREHVITGPTRVRCGPIAPGSELTITPVAAASPAPPPYPPPPPSRPVPTPSLDEPTRPPGFDQTQVLAAQPSARSGPDLLLVAEGQEHRFRHPAQITIGRLPDCTVVLTDPAASRLHGTVTATPGGWTYTNQSNEGTFLGGRRVTVKPFTERTELRLGHPVAGPELTLVPVLSAAEEERRIARQRLVRALLVAGIAAGVLVLVAGIAVAAVVLSGDDEPGSDGSSQSAAPSQLSSAPPAGGSPDELTQGELDAAKAATVKIIAESHALEDPDDEFAYAGSGSIIRSDGLILTNAHVAAPETPGVVEQYGPEAAIADPEFLLISLTDGETDTTSPPEYRARVVAADGPLDVAVVQVYAEADGSELEGALDLPTVPIGESAGLRAGDDVTVLGFPAVARSGDSITVTSGLISTVINDPDLGPRSEFDTDARIAPGNSGGMAVDNDGRLIGLPTALQFDPGGSGVASGRIRAIDVVREVIAEAERAVG